VNKNRVDQTFFSQADENANGCIAQRQFCTGWQMAQARSLIRFMGNSPLSHKVSKQQYK
jgi:hypothetical protein